MLDYVSRIYQKFFSAYSTFFQLFFPSCSLSLGSRSSKLAKLNFELLHNPFQTISFFKFSETFYKPNTYKKWARTENKQKRGRFCLFSFFSQCKDKHSTNLPLNDKIIDGGLGTRTGGGRMEGADESTDIWRPPDKPNTCRVVVVAQLAEQSLSIPNVHGSNPVIGKFFKMNMFTVNKCFEKTKLRKKYPEWPI